MKDSDNKYYRLTHPQKRVWYLDKINEESALNNIGGCLQIKGNINVDIMKQAINIIIKNNDGLRLRFLEEEGEPIQYVQDYKYENIDFLDFSKYENPKDEYEKWSKEVFKKRLKLDENKVYYFAIYKINNNEFGVLLNIHHIISDGWSVSIIQKQLCEIYKRLTHDEDIDDIKYYSYLDFIDDEDKYLKSERFKKNKGFWKEVCKDMPEEFLYNTSNNLKGNRKSFNIDKELTNEIKRFVSNNTYSLNTFFIAAALIYINKTTHNNDIVVGTSVFNRSGKAQKNMIGMFTSTVPFRLVLDDEVNIKELMKLVNRNYKLCLVNQKYSYDLLINDLNSQINKNNSLFKICVNYYNSKYDNNIDGLNVELDEYYCGSQSYSLQIIVKEWGDDNITLSYDYKVLEYSDKEIEVMNEVILNIIKQIVRGEELLISDIESISEEERNCKIYNFNSTKSPYPQKAIYELIEEQAEKNPDKIALEFKGEKITYKKLNEKANQLSNYFINKGIDNKSIIGIMQTHSIELIISILAVLKSGAAYLPIDPNYPADRINYILEDSRSKILLTNFKVEDNIDIQGECIDVRDINIEDYSNNKTLVNTNIQDLAYVIYTSGSTGKPKGVMIKHQGLTNYICWAAKVYLKDENEVMPLYSSISFDLTVTSIFTPLISGNKIIIYENDEDEFVLYKILRENKSTVVKLTPAHLTLLKDNDNSKLKIKRFIVGGEALKVSLAKEVSHSFNNEIEIYNEYGPTETVVGCMIYKYDENKDKGLSVPIGVPADNVQIYLLDKNFNIVPDGIEGEIYISGDGVAKGYLNRADLTSERFINNPFIPGKIMYKTGDTARYLENGIIDYIGRIDNQVKIKGHRIELGEIEKYISKNENVADAAVVMRKNVLGNDVINAYVVSKNNLKTVELKKWLSRFLLDYMMPTNYIFMDKIPITTNGKIDYKALPDVVVEEKQFVNFETDIEKNLVDIMKEVLQVETISMNDNFYQIGGDSIKAIQISSKLKNLGLSIKVKDILSLDTIREIADSVEESLDDNFIEHLPPEGSIKDTPIIEWFFNKKLKFEDKYNQYICIKTKESIDAEKVKIAAEQLIKYHDGLRINYDRSSRKLRYNNTNNLSPFKYIDLSAESFDYKEITIEQLIDKANINFKIDSTLLFNIVLFDLGMEGQVLLFIAHHLIVDGVSWRIIIEDFFSIIKQLESKKEATLIGKSNSFKYWSEAIQEYRKKDFTEEKLYWKERLNGDFIYPVDFNKGRSLVSTSNNLSREVDEKTLSELIKNANEVYNMDLNEVLIIILVLTISDMSNKNHVLIEMEGHGREAIDDTVNVSRTVGWFTSIYPAAFNITSNDLRENIKDLKEQLREIPNKGFNYGILSFLNKELEISDNKYIRFNYLGSFDSVINNQNIDISSMKFGLDSHKDNELTSLMDINAININNGLKIELTYSKNEFKDFTIEKFLDRYIENLNLILDTCMEIDNKEFTPSDFDVAEISQDDLDSLFD